MEIFISGLSQMNKPIRFGGLSSLQLGGAILFSIILFLFLAVSGQIILGIVLVSAIWFFLVKVVISKLRREFKKGTPNYLDSYFIFSGTPRKIADKSFIFSFMINKKDNGTI